MKDDVWLRPAPCFAALACCLVVAGCTPSAADAPAMEPASKREAVPALPARGAATELAVRATGCWLGGLWGDVDGKDGEERASDARTRCKQVIEVVYQGTDSTKLEQLRAIDTHALLPLRQRIRELALTDSLDRTRVEAVLELFDTAAMAARESMEARRAAHRLLHDLRDEPDMLPVDELPAVESFARVSALDTLLHVVPASLRSERRVVGLLVALDRSGESRALPVGLKPYLCAPVYASVFGTPAPDVPPAPEPPPAPGVWLQYLQLAAETAGHPAPPLVSRQRRAREAEAGILAGFADQLQASSAQLEEESSLRGVADHTVGLLRDEVRTVRRD